MQAPQPMTHESTRAVAFAALDPLIDYCKAVRGATSDVLRRLNARLQTDIKRTQFEKWLIRDRARRTEPALGAGLLLLDVWREIQRTRQFKEWAKEREQGSNEAQQ